MALTIGTNVASLQASAAASSVNRDLETSMARLSTGKRINSAADDAAGVAIASRLSSEIRGTDQAIRNALDGQALIDTAEGGHKEIEAILQRMREVAIQGASDTNNEQDRGNLQAEMDALRTEIDRIAGVTTWAGNSVMDGGAGGATKTFSLQVGAATGTKNQIDVAIGSMASNTLTVGKTYAHGDITDGTGAAKTAAKVTMSATTTSAGADLKLDGIEISISQIARTAVEAATAMAAAINASSEASSRGITAVVDSAATTQINIIFGQGSATILTANGTGTNDTAAANSREAVALIDAAIKTVNTQRSELGAVSNRLSHTVSNMTNISTNLSAARGGIEDADFALETTNLAKNQILQQASTAMLAQANASKQNVLSLLQG
jgi:flagellin